MIHVLTILTTLLIHFLEKVSDNLQLPMTLQKGAPPRNRSEPTGTASSGPTQRGVCASNPADQGGPYEERTETVGFILVHSSEQSSFAACDWKNGFFPRAISVVRGLPLARTHLRTKCDVLAFVSMSQYVHNALRNSPFQKNNKTKQEKEKENIVNYGFFRRGRKHFTSEK